MNRDSDPRLEQAALQPDLDPLTPQKSAGNRRFVLLFGLVLMMGLFMTTGKARAAWDEIAQLLSLKGKPEPASANVLSEHEIETLDQMSPQSQAQLLLERLNGQRDRSAQRIMFPTQLILGGSCVAAA